MKKIFRILLGVLVLSVIILAPSTMVQAGLSDEKAAAEKQIEEFKKNIADANGNLQKIEEQVNVIKNKIIEIDGKLVTINKEITVIEGNIVVKTTEIENATIEFNNKKAVFFENLRSNYEKGGVDYTAVILDSTDLTDFINFNEYFRIVREKEQEKIREIVAAKEALEVQKMELQQIQETLAAKKADIVTQKKQQSIEQQKLDSQKAYFASLASKYRAELAKEEAELEIINRRIIEAMRNTGGGNLFYTGNGIFAWPVPSSNRITSDYGWRSSPIFGGREFHRGIDIGASGGAAVVSADNGIVLLSHYSSSFGHTVVVNHGSGIMTLYAHLSSRAVSAGQTVTRGQNLGRVGTTGWSTGNHLHFQVTNTGDIHNGHVDPNIYLRYR